MPKMTDVAKRAGVSLKTVSRVLNNEPYVQQDVRDRVRAAVSELGYVPSATARSLRSSRSYTIQILCRSDPSNYVNAIQFGAMLACQKAGYQMIVSFIEPDDQASPDAMKRFYERITQAGRPDGVILVSPLSNVSIIQDRFESAGVNVARLGPNDLEDRGFTIAINEFEAAYELPRDLISDGHQRIAFLRGKEDQNATHERFKGFTRALEEAGLSVDPALVHKGRFNFNCGLEAGFDLLKLPTPPTAIFAANDDMAAGVIVAAHRLGIDVPNDVSVVGFDDSELAEKMWPALTTVRQPLQELGRIAAERLIGSAGSGQAPKSHRVEYLEHNIVHRASVTKPRGK